MREIAKHRRFSLPTASALRRYWGMLEIMRILVFRNPGVLAAVAFASGIIGKWAYGSSFSVGWTMVVVLWLLPLVLIGTIDEYLPGGWPRARAGFDLFASREKRTELLAFLALPAFGFAIDIGIDSLLSLALLAAGVIGIGACVHLQRIQRARAAGHDL